MLFLPTGGAMAYGVQLPNALEGKIISLKWLDEMKAAEKERAEQESKKQIECFTFRSSASALAWLSALRYHILLV